MLSPAMAIVFLIASFIDDRLSKYDKFTQIMDPTELEIGKLPVVKKKLKNPATNRIFEQPARSGLNSDREDQSVLPNLS